jgi:hypothetical protein
VEAKHWRDYCPCGTPQKKNVPHCKLFSAKFGISIGPVPNLTHGVAQSGITKCQILQQSDANANVGYWILSHLVQDKKKETKNNKGQN